MFVVTINSKVMMNYDFSKQDGPHLTARHENTPPLHVTYDEDITLLRQMLKQQEEATEKIPKDIEEVKVQAQPDKDLSVPPKGEKLSLLEGQYSYSANTQHEDNYASCSCNCTKEFMVVKKERDELKVRFRRGEASRTTIVERQELERALHSAKAELFQKQKRFRQRIEDLEDKIEESQHVFDERLAEKDDKLLELQQKMKLLETTEVPSVQEDKSSTLLKEELGGQQQKVLDLQEVCNKKNREIDTLHYKLKDQSRLSENISHQLLENERKTWKNKMQEVEDKLSSVKEEHEDLVKHLESENQHLKSDVKDFKQKLMEASNEIQENSKSAEQHEKESNRERAEWLERESDLREKNQQLQEKVEKLKLELSQAFSKNSHLEIDLIKKEKLLKDDYMAKINERREEVGDLHQKIENLQLEVADALLKAKTSTTEGERRDRCISSAVLDLCHKLSLLHNTIEPNDALRLNCSIAGSTSSKEALSKLEHVVQLVSRRANEQICEVERLRRQTKRHSGNQISSLRSNSDVDCLSEELKLVRGRLQDKEDELHQLQVNMEHWKELTAQRLARKFQEELQLQVDKKVSQNRESGILSHAGHAQLPNSSRSSLSSVNDSSTVKLLCHLQSRVKQLRTENDLLRSSSFIKELGK